MLNSYCLEKTVLVYTDKNKFLDIFPWPKFCSSAVYAYYVKYGRRRLERIQRSATGLNPELRDCSYDEICLKDCSLTTLEKRRKDQIEFYKILNGYENVNRSIYFKLKEVLVLVKERCT